MSRELYDLIPVVCGVYFIIYGIMMMACPKVVIKKKYREDPVRIAMMKKMGIFVMICGLIVTFIQFI